MLPSIPESAAEVVTADEAESEAEVEDRSERKDREFLQTLERRLTVMVETLSRLEAEHCRLEQDRSPAPLDREAVIRIVSLIIRIGSKANLL